MSRDSLSPEILLEYIGDLIDSMSLMLKSLVQSQGYSLLKSLSQPEYIYTLQTSISPNLTRITTYTFRILEGNRLELVSEEVEDKEQ